MPDDTGSPGVGDVSEDTSLESAGGHQGAPTSSADLEELGKRLQGLELSVRFKSTQVARLQTLSNILSLAFVGVLLMFVALFYTALTDNFTIEKFQAAVNQYGADVVEPVSDAAVDVAMAVYPNYQRELSEKWLEWSPRIADTVEREFVRFAEDVGTSAHEHLEATFRRVLLSRDGALRKALPELKLSNADVTAMMDKEVKGLKAFLDAHVRQDVETLHALLFKFDNKPLPNDQLKLSKLLSHNLLMLVDDEIMEVR